MSEDTAVPKYAVEHLVDGDGNETIQIAVALPGIKSGADIKCIIQDRWCRVVVPGLYRVEIPLSCPVESKAESVRYVKKKEVLKCVLRVQQGDRASSSDEEGASAQRGSRQANGSAQQAQQARRTAGLRDVYQEAKQQAAREAAEDCERLAWAAEQQGDLERAVRLLQKACQLVPGANYEQLLAEAERKLASSGSGADASNSNSSRAGTAGAGPSAAAASSSSSTAGAGGSAAGHSGTAHSAAPPPRQPQPPRQSPPPPPTPQQQQQQRQQAGEEDEERWQGQSSGARRALVPGSAVSLVLGLSLMAAAGYCMYGVTWHQLPTQLEEEGLVQAGSAAAAAAAAAASVIRSSDAGAATAKAGADAAAAAAGAASAWQRWPVWHPPMRCPKSMFVEGDGPCDVSASLQPDGANRRQPDSSSQEQPATCSGEEDECGDLLGPDQPGEAAADGSGGACSGDDCGGRSKEPGWLWRSLQGLQGRLAWASPAWHAVSWLPRTLLWDPSWEVVVCWAMFVGGVYLFLPSAQQMLLGSDWLLSKPIDWRNWCILAGWQPVGWLACGGGWLALIEVPMSWFASGPLRIWLRGRPDPYKLGGVTLMYFLASLAIRWLGPYLLLLLLAPLRWVVWAPRWWTHAPLIAAGVAYKLGKPEDHTPANLAVFGSTLLGFCWLSGGGWGAVASLSLFMLAPFSFYLDSEGRVPPAYTTGLRILGLALPLTGVVGRLVWMFSHSLWATVPVALALLGLLAVWQADVGGSSKGGSGGGKPGSGGGPFNFFGRRGARQQRKGGAGGIPAHLEHEVPAGAPEAVARVLSSGNYYEVLGVERDADEATIKRAKRTLSLATHPDKIGNMPGVNEAFNLVTEAADVLGDAGKRGEYEAELTQLEFEARLGSEAPGGGIFGGMGAAAAGMAGSDGGGEPGFGLPHACNCCGGVHIMRLVPRMAEMARYCGDCKALHPVREGEVWIERSRSGWFGYELRMYTCYGGLVWDISELGNCEGLFRAARQYDFPFNAHTNPLGGFGRGPGSSRAGGRGERRRQQQEEKGRNKGGRKNKGRRR